MKEKNALFGNSPKRDLYSSQQILAYLYRSEFGNFRRERDIGTLKMAKKFAIKLSSGHLCSRMCQVHIKLSCKYYVLTPHFTTCI